MKTIWTIFKKEIKEIFRDKKNLYMVFGVPLILMPLLLVGVFEITKIFAENVSFRPSSNGVECYMKTCI